MKSVNLEVPYMAWYIFSPDNYPLCWAEDGESPCLEFENEISAKRFLQEAQKLDMLEDIDKAIVKECIFYYDGGKMNATGLIPVANGDDIELKEDEMLGSGENL